MLASKCLSLEHGLLEFSSSLPIHSWCSRSSAQQPGRKVSLIVCVGVSQENQGVTDGKEWRCTVKDVWRSKRNAEYLQKFSDAAESTSYVSEETAHKDRLREHLTYLSSSSAFSTRHGLSFANVGDASKKDLEKSFTKKPSQRSKDVWRAQKQSGGKAMGTGAFEGKVDVSKSQKRMSLSSTMGSMALTEEHSAGELGVPESSDRYTESMISRKRVGFGWDAWSNEDGLATNLKSLGGNRGSRKRLYLVDVHALCYDGNKVRPRKVVEWLKLLFTEVTQANPIIAVMDGERGNEYRRKLLPSYKANRNFYKPFIVGNGHSSAANDLRRALPLIRGFFTLCHIPVVKREFAEADDVIASLASQARQEGFEVVIASPDTDFKQLLTPDVHMLLPVPELGRWSFYTLQHYVSQHTVTPDLELGLKCMLGDVSDNVLGLSDVAPGFGRKTALKLMQKHGSLERLLTAAATRTVGKEYVQDALTKHADLLRRNLQVLSLRRDVDVVLEEQWCRPRCLSNDFLALELLNERLQSG